MPNGLPFICSPCKNKMWTLNTTPTSYKAKCAKYEEDVSLESYLGPDTAS